MTRLPPSAPSLFRDWSVTSMVWKLRGSTALVMANVLLPPDGTTKVPAEAACAPSWLRYQHSYQGSSPKGLRCCTVKVTPQLPEASWGAIARPVAAPKPCAMPAAVTRSVITTVGWAGLPGPRLSGTTKAAATIAAATATTAASRPG